MRRTRFADWDCSIARATDILGDWWTPLVVRSALLGVRRFDDFVEMLGIPRNVLTERLARLVDEGILAKVKYQERPVRYEYRLTDKGVGLYPVIVALSSGATSSSSGRTVCRRSTWSTEPPASGSTRSWSTAAPANPSSRAAPGPSTSATPRPVAPPSPAAEVLDAQRRHVRVAQPSQTAANTEPAVHPIFLTVGLLAVAAPVPDDRY